MMKQSADITDEELDAIRQLPDVIRACGDEYTKDVETFRWSFNVASLRNMDGSSAVGVRGDHFFVFEAMPGKPLVVVKDRENKGIYEVISPHEHSL